MAMLDLAGTGGLFAAGGTWGRQEAVGAGDGEEPGLYRLRRTGHPPVHPGIGGK